MDIQERERRDDLLARINEMNVELERIRPPHAKQVRDELRAGAELLLTQLEAEGPLDRRLVITRELMETFLWALRLAEEQLPAGMARQ